LAQASRHSRGDPLRHAAMLVAAGTYTEPAGHVKGELGLGIYTFWADEEGRLTPTGSAPLKSRNPTYLVRHPSKPILYACQEVSAVEGFGDEASAVIAVRFDEATGALELVNERAFPGAIACHVDTDGAFLFVACYVGRSGAGLVHSIAIEADGSLGPLCDSAELHHASGAAGDEARGGLSAGRQETSHAHMACLSQGRVFVPDLGGDTMYCFEVADGGKLRPAANANLTVGSGPRHCVASSAHDVVYVISELTEMIDVVDRRTMSSIQRVSALPDEVDLSGNPFFRDVVKHANGSAIKLSPDGRTLYGSNRGHDSIVVCEVLDDGRIAVRGHIHTEGQTPRDFFVGPNGKYVLAMNQDSGTIVRFATGEGGLTSTGESFPLPAPVTMIELAAPKTSGGGSKRPAPDVAQES